MAKSVGQYLNGILNISKYIGISPITITNDNNLKISKFNIIWVSIVQLLMSISSILVTSYPPNYVNVDIFTAALTSQRVIFFQLSLIVHAVAIAFNRDKLNGTLETLNKIDCELSIVWTIPKWKPLLCFVLLLSILSLKTTLVEFSYYEMISLVFTHYQCSVIFFIMFQFSSVLNIYCSFFDNMSQLLKQSPNRIFLERSIDFSDQLIESCKNVNYCFGPFLLIGMIAYLFFITTNLYVTYSFWECKNITITLVGGLRVFLFLFTLHSLLSSCTQITETVEDFYQVINRTVLECRQVETLHSNILNPAMILRRKLEITALNYFRMNNGLFCSILASTIGYLIIFIQFKHQDNQ